MDRKRLSDYNPNDQEKVRRAYLLRGPYQPCDHKFPQTTISRKKRKFNVKWFKLYESWLEYSVKGDAAYCLYCYLCADNVAQSDDTSFIKGGFRNWKKSEKFRIHIGGVNSSHNQCRRKCEDLMNQNQHIEHSFVKQTPQMKIEYQMRLLASIDCVRWCLHQGISFRAHDESDDSINMGNFKELHKFLIEHSEEPKKSILLNAPKNNKLTSHDIQVDIASACASETTKAIVEDIGDECFSILVDECRDVSTKEQMAIEI